MKRCPECRRDYTDETLNFCLDDGAALLDGPASGKTDEPQTTILHTTDAVGDAPTRVQPHTTDQTAVLLSQAPELRKRSFDRRHMAALLVLVVVALGGFAGYRYFASPSINSIAIMPFLNESGNADVEYLSDGMTETLIKSLSNLPNLNVKPRSSVFRYKGKDVDLQTVAKELNVQAILNGRVSERGDELSLSLELVDVQKDSVIWTEKYVRKASDLAGLQSEIGRDVSGQLKSKLPGADQAKVTKNDTANSEAYQLYLKGRYQWNQRTGEALKEAADNYQQAIGKDPTYALAYAALAETYVLFSSYDVASANDSMPQAKAAALRALEIDDTLAEAHTALGFYFSVYEWDRAGAEKEYRRAIELNPNYATAHHWFASNFENVKQFDECIAELKVAEKLDPLSPIITANLADAFGHAHRFDEAIAEYKRNLILNPNFARDHEGLGVVYGVTGRYAEAIAETRTSIQLNNGTGVGKGYLALWLAKSGHRDEAVKLLDELKQRSSTNYVQSFTFALIYIGLGDKEGALNSLEKEVSGHSEMANSFGILPELDDLRSEPRFKAFLKRMNLPE